MKNIDENKWKKFESGLQIGSVMLALAIGEVISSFFSIEAFLLRLGVYIAVVIVLAPVQALIKSMVNNVPVFRKFLEEK